MVEIVTRLPTPAELLPHGPPLVLVDEILKWDGTTVLCRSVIRATGPQVRAGQVPAYFCVELMAQAIGCAAGLLARARGEFARPPLGFVLGGRELNFYVDAVRVGDTLDLEATHVFGDSKFGNFRSQVRRGEHLIAQATINVYSGPRL